jgi:hypothetical protein
MQLPWLFRGSVLLLTLVSSTQAWSDEFVNFFRKQKMGQEITVTGGFRRFSYRRHFFQRDYKTGDVQYFDYFGTSMVPTKIIGDGSLSLRASLFDTMLLVYPDEELVKDLPEQGENLWFTGTLVGFQYGISGIIDSALSGGDPYILLKKISLEAPPEAAQPGESDQHKQDHN